MRNKWEWLAPCCAMTLATGGVLLVSPAADAAPLAVDTAASHVSLFNPSDSQLTLTAVDSNGTVSVNGFDPSHPGTIAIPAHSSETVLIQVKDQDVDFNAVKATLTWTPQQPHNQDIPAFDYLPVKVDLSGQFRQTMCDLTCNYEETLSAHSYSSAADFGTISSRDIKSIGGPGKTSSPVEDGALDIPAGGSPVDADPSPKMPNVMFSSFTLPYSINPYLSPIYLTPLPDDTRTHPVPMNSMQPIHFVPVADQPWRFTDNNPGVLAVGVDRSPVPESLTISYSSAQLAIPGGDPSRAQLVLNNVVFAHAKGSQTYVSRVPSMTLMVQAAGTSGSDMVFATGDSAAASNELVVPDLTDGQGSPDPDNQQLAGQWLLRVGLELNTSAG